LASTTTATWKALCSEAKNWDTSAILSGQKHLKESVALVKNSTQPKLWLEVTLLELLPMTSPTTKLTLTVPSESSRNAELEQTATTTLNTATRSHSEDKAQVRPVIEHSISEPVQRELELKTIWNQVLSKVQATTLKALLEQHGKLADCKEGNAIIRITSQQLLNLAAPKKPIIETAFFSALGQPIAVTFTTK
jgi:DNA polymerase-3 subunit gamma/tau